MMKFHRARRTGRRALAILALSGAVAGTGPVPPTLSPSLPLDPLLDLLSQRAALYEKAALGFSCDETVLLGKFSARSGENKKEDETRYNYLYEGDPNSGFVERRFRAGRNDAPEEARIVDPDLPVPGAYDWALLFTGRHRPFFRFESAGEELVGFHSTRVVAFRGGAAWVRGRQIEEWSGKIWVDSETGNFVKIVAAPNQQEDLLPLRMTKWLQGIRLGGVPMKKQPRGYRYQISFTVEKFGLTFPGEAVTRLFVLTPQGEEEIRERVQQTFRNYVFFNVHSEQEFLGTAGEPGPKPKP
jgi:hypothetical protein